MALTSVTPDHATTVQRLRDTFTTGRTRDASWRAEQLAALGRLLSERRDEITQALVDDLRRTPLDAKLLDLVSTQGEIAFARKHLGSWMRPQKVATPMAAMPGKAWFKREPFGVTMIISPWNYPIHLALGPLVGAIAAGNCAVIKPSELAPASSAVMARLLPLYLDPDAFAVVEGGAETSLALLELNVDHCFFTGSPAVGKAIMTAAARHLTPVTLELGGKCPVIVTQSANLEVAARRIAFGKLLNSGQSCVAPDYVLVERSVRDTFVELMAKTLKEFSEGKSVPIINARHAGRLAQLVQSSGGTTLLGGDVNVEAATAEPSVILDPDPGAAILQEEIFGPILPILSVESLDAALSHVAAGSRPLASYLFTEDKQDENRFLASVSTGGVLINHVMLHLSVPELPFGGVGQSGTGSYHGRWGFEAFSYPRAVLRKPSKPDITMMYPPYSRLARRLLTAMTNR